MQMQSTQSAPFGVTGVILGALALITALVAIYAGPFAPQQDLGVSLGEVAGDALKATVREVLNRPQPAPEVRMMTVDDYMQIGVILAGVAAIVLAVLAAFRKEPRALLIGAAGLGAAALVFQFLAWMALVIIGALLIMSVLSIFGGGL